MKFGDNIILVFTLALVISSTASVISSSSSSQSVRHICTAIVILVQILLLTYIGVSYLKNKNE
ncbi:hypothetical protein ACVRXF_08445 [Streptococcus orisasini]